MPAGAEIEPSVLGVILAGGLARRMGGGDKPLVSAGGKPMLQHVVERLRIQVERAIISANGDPSRFARFGLPVVPDSIQGFVGPLAGILAGMQWARTNVPKAPLLLSVAGDTPFFPSDLVARLIEASRGDQQTIAIAESDDGMQPVFGLWPVALADDLEAFLKAGESGKIMAFVRRHQYVKALFQPLALPGGAVHPFFNVNTPQDAAEADRIAALLAVAGR